MSVAHRGHPISTEARAKIGAANSNPSAETRARMSAAHDGRVVSETARANIRAASLAHREACDGTCGRWDCGPIISPTGIELKLWALLDEFPTVIRDASLPGTCCAYRPDAYLPEYRLAFEADGYYHTLPSRAEDDARRDAHLLEVHGIVTIRLTEAELMEIGAA